MKSTRKDAGQDREHNVGKEQGRVIDNLSPAQHKRILKYLNDAASPFDLMHVPIRPMSSEQMADMGQARARMDKRT